MDDAKWREFQRTCIRVTLPEGTLDVEPTEQPFAGGFLADARGPIHVLTAWNPQGFEANAKLNEDANERLAAELRAQPGVVVWPVTGYGGGPIDDDEMWREDGFGIEGLTRDAAIALAISYGHRAIFEWRNEPGGFRLVSCDESADEPRGWQSTFTPEY